MIMIGTGDYRYEYRPDWTKLPVGMEFQFPSAVAVDSHDNLYVFQRGDPPMLVFDHDGNMIAQWTRKDGVPADAHLIYVCLLYTSPSPRDRQKSRMPSSA